MNRAAFGGRPAQPTRPDGDVSPWNAPRLWAAVLTTREERHMLRIARHRAQIAAAALVSAAALAGCSGGPDVPLRTGFGGAFGTVPAATTGAQHAGTITWAERGQAPTWILPLVDVNDSGVNNVYEFEYEMWRPLYWFGDGVEPTQTPSMSLASAPE